MARDEGDTPERRAAARHGAAKAARAAARERGEDVSSAPRPAEMPAAFPPGRGAPTSALAQDRPVPSIKPELLVSGRAGRAEAAAPPFRAGLRNAWLSAPMILGIEVAANIAYFSVSANLVIYLTKVLERTPATAALESTALTGLSYMCVLLGGYLADAALGRALTVLASGVLFTLGLLMLTISSVFASASVNSSHTADLAFFFLSQVLMGLAVGGIKPNLSALGADQFDDFGPKGEPLKDKERFFTWYYFFINIGALLASTVLVYVQTSVSWTLGFALPTTLAIAAVAVYVVGWKGYRRLPPGGPALYQVFQTFYLAIINRGRALPDDPLDLYEADHDSDDEYAPMPLAHTDDMAWLDKAAIVPRGVSWPLWGDPAPTDFVSVSQVEETKQMVRLMPVWCTLLVWNLCYAQMASIMWGQFELPPASVLIFATITILILVPINDRLVQPQLERKGWEPTSLQRAGFSQLWMAIAMAIAAIVCAFEEPMRSETMISHSNSVISVVFLIPQIVALGISEFFFIGMIEFFYQQAPERMRSLAAALELVSFGIASFIASALIAVVNKNTEWLPGKGAHNDGDLQ